jgi:hypothetical protein
MCADLFESIFVPDRGSIRVIALKHHQFSFGWEVIMGQTLRPGNADYPVDPGCDPLSLDHLPDPYLYFPKFRSGIRQEGQG